MAKDYAGETPLDHALSRLGVAPEKPVSVKDRFDTIARQTQVPANVLLALDDGSGDPAKAEANAQFLSRAVQGGTKIEDAVKALAGDDAAGQELLKRSYQIAEQFYPQQQPAEGQGDEGGSVAGDLGKLTVGGAVRGTGSAIRGAGAMIDDVAQRYRGTRNDPGESLVRSGSRAAGETVESVGDAVSDSVSEETKAAQQGTQPSGELLDPRTWTLGEDPSLRGIAALGAEGIGSMVPVVAAALVGGPGAAASVGGAMGGGEGASNARKFVMDAATTEGDDGRPVIESLPEYQKLVEAGRSPSEAADILAQRAESDSAFAQSIPAALGGMATSKIISKADGWLGRGGRISRAVRKGGAGALEEGTQEAIEGAAGKAGIEGATGADLNLAEDTFGDFVAGSLAGGPIGATAGALGQGDSAQQGQPTVDPDTGAMASMGAVPGPDGPAGLLPPPPVTLPSPQNPDADGSGVGPAAAPEGAPSLSGGGPGAAAQYPFSESRINQPPTPADYPFSDNGINQPQRQYPFSESGMGNIQPPVVGPVSELAQGLPPAPQEEAPAPQRFPEHKPGSSVRLFDPATETPVDGVFLGETENGALVRIGGDEVELDPAQFDSARDAAKAVDEAAKEQAKQQKEPDNAGSTGPQTSATGGDVSQLRVDDGGAPGGEGTPSPESPVPEGTGDVSGMDGQPDAGNVGEAGQGDFSDGALAGDAGESGNELTGNDDLSAMFDDLADEKTGTGPQVDEAEQAPDAQQEGLSGTDEPQGPVSVAAEEADPEPTEGQKEAGNYKKGHARWQGLDLSIVNQRAKLPHFGGL